MAAMIKVELLTWVVARVQACSAAMMSTGQVRMVAMLSAKEETM